MNARFYWFGILLLGSVISLPAQSLRETDRATAFNQSAAAAQAAVDKVIGQMTQDVLLNGPDALTNNLSAYTATVPTAADDPDWANYTFANPCTGAPGTFVSLTNSAPVPVSSVSDQFPGVGGLRSTYTIAAAARKGNGRPVAVRQSFAVGSIPIFAFAVFYEGLMEFTWNSELTLRNGFVYSGSNIFVGSSLSLSFSNLVFTTQTILTTNWYGHTTNEFTGPIVYGSPLRPGYVSGSTPLTLPIGSNNDTTNLHAIIDPPPPFEDPGSPLGRLRFYNQANLVIMVSNNSVNLVLRDQGLDDPNPVTIDSTWTNADYGITNWLSTNVSNTFYDSRENKIIKLTQIDVGKFRQWTTNNSYALTWFPDGAPKIVYVADYRYPPPTTNYLSGVRLTNGTTLPSGGLTLATPNPLYVLGNYNTPLSANLNSTNTAGTVPASLISDALTILSRSWADSKSSSSLASRNAPVNTTINAAIITGAVPSVDNTSSGFSGGVVNLPRFLENWSTSKTLTLNTSLVNLFNSAWATNKFKAPGTYYNAPNRDYNFDPRFSTLEGLPPGTPMVHFTERLAPVAFHP